MISKIKNIKTKTNGGILVIGFCGLFFYPLMTDDVSFLGYLKGFMFFICGAIVIVILFEILKSQLTGLIKEIQKSKKENQIDSVGYPDKEKELDLRFEEEFKEYFRGSSFTEVKNVLLKNGVIDKTGKYIFSERKRDIYMLVIKLIEEGVLDSSNMVKLCDAASRFFKAKVDNPQTTDMKNILAIDGFSSLKKNDRLAYTKFSFINNIKA